MTNLVEEQLDSLEQLCEVLRDVERRVVQADYSTDLEDVQELIASAEGEVLANEHDCDGQRGVGIGAFNFQT